MRVFIIISYFLSLIFAYSASRPSECPLASVFDGATLTCTPCPPTQTRQADNTCGCTFPLGFTALSTPVCAICPTGSVPSTSGLCTACTGTADCTAPSAPTCPAGQYLLRDTTSVTCSECATDTEPSSGLLTCTHCPAGTTWAAGTCACPAGLSRHGAHCANPALVSAVLTRHPGLRQATITTPTGTVRVTTSAAAAGVGGARGLAVASAQCTDDTLGPEIRAGGCAELAHLCALAFGAPESPACRESTLATTAGAPDPWGLRAGDGAGEAENVIQGLLATHDAAAGYNGGLKFGQLDIVVVLRRLDGTQLGALPLSSLMPAGCTLGAARVGWGQTTSCIISPLGIEDAVARAGAAAGTGKYELAGSNTRTDTTYFMSFYARFPSQTDGPVSDWHLLPVVDLAYRTAADARNAGLRSGAAVGSGFLMQHTTFVSDRLVCRDVALTPPTEGCLIVMNELTVEMSVASLTDFTPNVPLVVVSHVAAELSRLTAPSPWLAPDAATDEGADRIKVTTSYAYYVNAHEMMRVIYITSGTIAGAGALVVALGVYAALSRSPGRTDPAATATAVETFFFTTSCVGLSVTLISGLSALVAGAGSPVAAPPEIAQEAAMIGAAVAFSTGAVAFFIRLYQVSQVHLLHIDWEGAVAAAAPVKLVTDGISAGGTGAGAGNNNNQQQQQQQQQQGQRQGPLVPDAGGAASGPSAWRFIHALSAWTSLQKRRRYSPEFCALATLFFLSVSNTERFTMIFGSFAASRPSLALCTIGYYVMCALVNVVFTVIAGHFNGDPVTDLLDVLSVANISLMLVDSPAGSYLHYLHGRSPAGQADLPLPRIMDNLRAEAALLAAGRGLEPPGSPDLQVYRVWPGAAEQAQLAQYLFTASTARAQRQSTGGATAAAAAEAVSGLRGAVDAVAAGAVVPRSRDVFSTLLDLPSGLVPGMPTPGTVFYRDTTRSFVRRTGWGMTPTFVLLEVSMLALVICTDGRPLVALLTLLVAGVVEAVGLHTAARHANVKTSLLPQEFVA